MAPPFQTATTMSAIVFATHFSKVYNWRAFLWMVSPRSPFHKLPRKSAAAPTHADHYRWSKITLDTKKLFMSPELHLPLLLTAYTGNSWTNVEQSIGTSTRSLRTSQHSLPLSRRVRNEPTAQLFTKNYSKSQWNRLCCTFWPSARLCPLRRDAKRLIYCNLFSER